MKNFLSFAVLMVLAVPGFAMGPKPVKTANTEFQCPRTNLAFESEHIALYFNLCKNSTKVIQDIASPKNCGDPTSQKNARCWNASLLQLKNCRAVSLDKAKEVANIKNPWKTSSTSVKHQTKKSKKVKKVATKKEEAKPSDANKKSEDEKNRKEQENEEILNKSNEEAENLANAQKDGVDKNRNYTASEKAEKPNYDNLIAGAKGAIYGGIIGYCFGGLMGAAMFGFIGFITVLAINKINKG